MTLGEQSAAEVLKLMEPREVQKLGVTMAGLTSMPKERVTQVLAEFVDTCENQAALGVGSEDYIRKMLVSAIGQDKAEGLIDRILHGGNTRGLEALKWMEARAVAELIRGEHPQIISIILAYLDPEQSAEVIACLPAPMQLDVTMRIASLDGIPPSALKELNEVMEKQFAGKSTLVSSSVGGVKAAASILNVMESQVESALIAKMKETDENLARQIEENMFVFENLMEIDDRGMQVVLREVSNDALLLALKGASEGIKDKIIANMSKRAGEMLLDDLAAKGPVRLSEVETAQKEILAVARKLADDGEIVLGGKGGEAYV